jgi:FMN phosphatase YigB (HAD superfamily)
VISALFIDLDDTLLENSMERFLPAYLERLGEHLSTIAPAERVVELVLSGSMAMVADIDPTKTLQQVFAEHFYPALGVTEEELQSEIENFYDSVFPRLQTLTKERSEAVGLVSAAFSAGMEVVIATSPLFPLTAIEQRLAWAGVPRDRFNYSLVTSYEKFHFAKPHKAYYAEILGRLGIPPHDAAMIGNDLTDDILPAQSLGMAVFHVDSSQGSIPGGSLTDAIAWLDVAGDQTNPEAENRPDTLIARLRGHTSAVLTMTAELDDRGWSQRPMKDEWAPNEIICHMRDVEREVHIPRIQAILSEESPHLSAFDTDHWAVERNYLHQSGPDALSIYSQARLETIGILESLAPECWSLPARHSLFGPTSLAEVLKLAIDHDVLHLAQLRSSIPQQEPLKED